MKKTWVEINHLSKGNMEHSWIIWNVRDDGIWVPRWVEIFAKSSCMHQRWSNKNSTKPQHLAWSNMAWGKWEIILENRNLKQFAIKNLDFYLSFVAQSFCLLLLLTWFAGANWPGGEISKLSQSSFNSFISKAKYTTLVP